MAALKVTLAEQSEVSAGKPITLSGWRVTSCHHQDTHLSYNQRRLRRLGLEAGLGGRNQDLLPGSLTDFSPQVLFQCSESVKGRS